MKAIRVHAFGGPEVLKLEDVTDPRPGPGQVVVTVKAAGVNPVETYIRSGRYGPRQFPFTPGSDAGGIVEAVGDGVSRFKTGDRVYLSGSLSGTYAQKALCTETQVHPLPPHVTYAQGAAMGIPYATAYRALFHRAQARAGETVLVHGASGGVGTAAVQMARAAGLTVLGTGGTDRGRALVTEQGAHHVLDHRAGDYTGRILELTGGRGVDVVIEMLANVNLDKSLNLLAKHGRLVVVGSRGRIEIDPRDTMRRDADIRGMTLFNSSEEDLRQIHAALVAGLENRTLRPIVGKELPLAEAARAHEAVMESGAYGKIALVP
ncbi:MAG TPA: NADPH:quinone reductase [Tepidisphaeraceae bacterium]|nr:NADPH:quinone reductase [Tepidisphaeraceae bacterium]